MFDAEAGRRKCIDLCAVFLDGVPTRSNIYPDLSTVIMDLLGCSRQAGEPETKWDALCGLHIVAAHHIKELHVDHVQQTCS